MKHRRMLIATIALGAIGFVLWGILAPIMMYYGIGSYTTGWWIFSETHHYETPLFWAGLGFAISGLILIVAAAVLLIVVIVLELTERKPTQPPSQPQIPIPP